MYDCDCLNEEVDLSSSPLIIISLFNLLHCVSIISASSLLPFLDSSSISTLISLINRPQNNGQEPSQRFFAVTAEIFSDFSHQLSPIFWNISSLCPVCCEVVLALLNHCYNIRQFCLQFLCFAAHKINPNSTAAEHSSAQLPATISANKSQKYFVCCEWNIFLCGVSVVRIFWCWWWVKHGEPSLSWHGGITIFTDLSPSNSIRFFRSLTEL